MFVPIGAKRPINADDYWGTLSTTMEERFVSNPDMLRDFDLDTRRQLYAEELRAVANLQSEALVRAFAKVPQRRTPTRSTSITMFSSPLMPGATSITGNRAAWLYGLMPWISRREIVSSTSAAERAIIARS